MCRKISIAISIFVFSLFLWMQGGVVFAAEIDTDETVALEAEEASEVVELEETESEVEPEAATEPVVESQSAEVLDEGQEAEVAEEVLPETDILEAVATEVIEPVKEALKLSLLKPNFVKFASPKTEDVQGIFNFIIDPFGFINATNAAHYDGANFEQGSVFFKNSDGQFDYSSHTDKLNITNSSSVPLKVTVTLTASNFTGVRFAQSKDFANDGAYIFLAIEDSEGNLVPMDENGQAVLTFEIPAAFVPSYTPVIDPDTDEIYLKMDEFDETAIVNYWFSITAACNDNEAWAEVADGMGISVTWNVEPVIEEEFEEVEIEDPDSLEKVSKPEENVEVAVEETTEKTEEPEEAVSDNAVEETDETVKVTDSEQTEIVPVSVDATESDESIAAPANDIEKVSEILESAEVVSESEGMVETEKQENVGVQAQTIVVDGEVAEYNTIANANIF